MRLKPFKTRRRPNQGRPHVNNTPKAGAGPGRVWAGTFSWLRCDSRRRAASASVKHVYVHTHGQSPAEIWGEIKALAGRVRSNSGFIHDAEPLNSAASHTTPFDRRPTRLGVSELEQTTWHTAAAAGGDREVSTRRSIDQTYILKD